MITVRRVRADEVEAYKRVRLAALADSPSAFGSTYEREVVLTDDEWAARVAGSCTGDARATFLALDGDEVVGLVGGYRDFGDVTELISMWTDPRARRSGAGRALVNAVLDHARATGASAVELWVTTGNDPAQRLYESMGFEITGDVKPHPNDPCANETRMRLRLR